jgi:hypothetical protein
VEKVYLLVAAGGAAEVLEVSLFLLGSGVKRATLV